ncbi:MAG TPA: RNA methyltransferase [Bacteroidia bacterium]|nr:RNA methyltransferase [Bacteroidia bacterium]
MLSKNKISEITALHQKKYRQSLGLFIVEGEKIIDEVISSNAKIVEVFCTPDLFEKYENKLPQLTLADPKLFAKISTLKTPAGILAVLKQNQYHIDAKSLKNNFTICLDGIRDPGNLGTIIRIADWFGIKNIICSFDTVDFYNPKTIQATMGSFLRVDVIYADLKTFLFEIQQHQIPIFGAVLNGQNIYQKQNMNQGVLLMGSESHGISAELLNLINEPITIPSKMLTNGDKEHQIDSLNVAIATSIICAVFAGQLK